MDLVRFFYLRVVQRRRSHLLCLEPPTELAIPVRWTAPEGYDGKHCLESDVWSYGVLLWEVFTNAKMPYHHLKTSIEVVNKVRDEDWPLSADSVSCRALALARFYCP